MGDVDGRDSVYGKKHTLDHWHRRVLQRDIKSAVTEQLEAAQACKQLLAF